MAITLPKLALPKIELDRKRLMMIAGAVVVLAAAAWFGLQYLEEPAPPPPPPKPVAAKAAVQKPVDTAAAQDKLIDDVLAASGLKQQLAQLPQELIAGAKDFAAQQRKASPALAKSIEDAVAQSFSAQGFQDRVKAELKKKFEQKKLQAFLQQLSAPAAKRMVALEQATPDAAEAARFARGPAIPPERKKLIERLDAAAKASDLAVDAAFASMKSVSDGIVGGDEKKIAAIDKEIEKRRPQTTANIRNATLANLAYSYRAASDAELDEYAKIYEGENGKWFAGIAYAAILDEIKAGSERTGDLLAAQSTAAPAPAQKHSLARADARACLQLSGNAAIMRCAEKYR